MKHLIATLALLTGGVSPLLAADTALPTLDSLKWVSRPIVVFADSQADPRLAQQTAEFERLMYELEKRDVVILIDTEPEARSELRTKLRPRDFQVIVLSKEGKVIYRKPTPITVREVIRHIDRQPLRREEIRNRTGTNQP